MIITNAALRASLVSIIRYPARPRKIIVKYLDIICSFPDAQLVIRLS